MKKKWIIPCLLVVIVIVILVYHNIQSSHTFTLSSEVNGVKSEQIQPLYGTVEVSGSCDTSVTFTDVETGKSYTIGYITPGLSEKIKLEKDKWYSVEGAGDITISSVNVRIE